MKTIEESVVKIMFFGVIFPQLFYLDCWLYISNEKLTPSKHSSYTLLACRSASKVTD